MANVHQSYLQKDNFFLEAKKHREESADNGKAAAYGSPLIGVLLCGPFLEARYPQQSLSPLGRGCNGSDCFSSDQSHNMTQPFLFVPYRTSTLKNHLACPLRLIFRFTNVIL